jgi:outer membrane protein
MDTRQAKATSVSGRRRCRRPALLAVLLAALVLPAPPALAQEAAVRIGYVDMQRLIDNAPQVAAARTRLEREFADRNALLDADATRLAAMEQRLLANGAALPGEETARLQREADALRRSIERTRSRLQQELNQRVDQELGRAWPAMEAAVAEYAREAGYDLVLASPQLYASGRIDITDRVLDRLRQQARAAEAQ